MLILYLHHGDKSPLIPEGSFLCGNFDYNYSSVYMATFSICVIMGMLHAKQWQNKEKTL